MQKKLPNIDLNLFLVLHTVLQTRNVTQAARTLHVTQSAISNALARLREMLGDPLLVRQGRGLVPTPRALELAPLIAEAIERLHVAVEGPTPFDPLTSERTFTLACADHELVTLIPAIAREVGKALPRCTLRVVSVDYLVSTNGLVTGEVDAALAPAGAALPPLNHMPLYVDSAVLLARKDHPRIRTRITKDLFNGEGFVEVLIRLGKDGVGHGHWKAVLARQGMVPRTISTVPQFIAAAAIVAATDHITGVPRLVAETFTRMLPLKILGFPVDGLPPLPMGIMWHPRTAADAGNQVFRSVVEKAVTSATARRG